MSTPFLGEIKLISWNFAPQGWAFCNGQLLPINQNQALFSLFGTMYGGNGQTTFALPDFRGRAALHFGNGFTQGEKGGSEVHTLTASEMPQHNHPVGASSQAVNAGSPVGNLVGVLANNNLYGAAVNSTMSPSSIGPTGGSQPHQNLQPFLCVNFIVALQGIFPSRN